MQRAVWHVRPPRGPRTLTLPRHTAPPRPAYYPVLVRADSDVLENKAGKKFPIVPGMVTTADIRTGRKTVWDYLTKPLNKANEALRER